ncbi:hypothetical protein [Streptomyces flavofungini]|uniref:hypothetical protein n=1 Tax=Streptomyces flavofungini TaxID=68200 RepID=UPI0034E0436C
MPADEVHHESSAGEPRARTGPRHAAPRKPLLTRLQVPAGKAIAIAAMPTAVLMGMGLTPTLAQAKPGVPDNPFQDGPCVTAPDKDAEDEAAKDADKAKEEAEEKAAREAAEKDAEKDAGDKASDEDKDGEGDGAQGEGKPSTTESPATGDRSGDGDEAKDEPSAEPSADGAGAEERNGTSEPEPTETRNPWDPLGLGDALKDAFTPDDKKEQEEKEQEKEQEKESGSPAPSTSGSEKSGSEKSGSEKSGSEDSGSEETDSSDDPVKDTTDKVTKPVEDTVGKVGDGLKDGVERGADAAKDAAGDAGDAEDKEGAEAEDPMAPDENGKKPFPCVVEKKVDGKGEQTPVPIPNQPWHLEASSLTLKGADYQGVVNLTMPNGKTKQALKYVVQNTDIGDLHQIVEGPAGKKYHVEAAKGSTSTIRGGETTMYTERISGKLFGLIPITFDPEHPPPLNIPLIYFTDVTVQQAGQFGGNLTIPGLHQSITG